MVEYLYPVVYVTELAWRATPIDGVPTSVPSAAAHAAETAAPDHASHNGRDPAAMLAELPALLAESSRFGSAPVSGGSLHVQPGYGTAQGLEVGSADGDAGASLNVSRGVALAADGRVVDTDDRPRDRQRARKP